jgi:hypothetical protein
MGIPVLSLSSWNVMLLSAGNRSKAATSMKSNERSPSRTAAAILSRGTPACSKPSTHRAVSTSPEENASPVPGVRIPSSTNRST